MLTLDAEGRRLRYQIAGMGAGRSRRYPPRLQREIVCWARAAQARGLSQASAAAQLGVPVGSIARWQSESGKRPPQVVAVEVVDDPVRVTPSPGGATLVMPSGVRVVGASVVELEQILRALG